jgi:hypothetical protein
MTWPPRTGWVIVKLGFEPGAAAAGAGSGAGDCDGGGAVLGAAGAGAFAAIVGLPMRAPLLRPKPS